MRNLFSVYGILRIIKGASWVLHPTKTKTPINNISIPILFTIMYKDLMNIYQNIIDSEDLGLQNEGTSGYYETHFE